MLTKRWTVAVISPEYRDRSNALARPFEFGDGVILECAPKWLKGKEVAKGLGRPYVHELKEAEYVLRKEYFADGFGQEHSDALRQMRRCNVSLWLARPSPIGFTVDLNVLFPDDAPVFAQHIGINNPFIHSPRDARNALSEEDLLKARALYGAMPQEGAVRTAIDVLDRALTEGNWSMRYLVLWIALEALFGPEDSREITHRIALRIAMMNGRTEPADGKKILYRKVKEAYSWRSKVVHGLKLNKLKPEKSVDLRDTSEELIRDALTLILLNPAVLNQLNDRGREDYLDGLVFGE